MLIIVPPVGTDHWSIRSVDQIPINKFCLYDYSWDIWNAMISIKSNKIAKCAHAFKIRNPNDWKSKISLFNESVAIGTKNVFKLFWRKFVLAIWVAFTWIQFEDSYPSRFFFIYNFMTWYINFWFIIICAVKLHYNFSVSKKEDLCTFSFMK